MKEQIIVIKERERNETGWKDRTVIGLWPFDQMERDRLQRFIDDARYECHTPASEQCREQEQAGER